MYQKVKAYVKEWQMLEKDDIVIAGVSGGADSVCLLFMLSELKEEIGFSLRAVHVNHGIRGEAADADEKYVRKLCEEQGIELKVCTEDVPAYAREHGMTEEEAGRQVRRTCFRKELEACGGTRIALAHHQNDNAETLIFNLCRGTGFRGLKGIAPRNGEWIRPFLCLKRKDIESYLKKRGISYCTDETNVDLHYTRNWIRHEIIPRLESRVNRESISHMCRTMEQMYSLGGYIEREILRYKALCVEPGKEKLTIKKQAYMQVPDELREYVIYEALCDAAGRRKDIERIHIKMLSELLERQTGRMLDLPHGVKACRCYEGAELLNKKAVPDKTGKNQEEQPGEMFRMDIFEKPVKEVIFPEKNYTKWFDYDIIKNTVKIRHRQPGDYITIQTSGGTQKLKQYFINEKIPQSERDAVWLLADGRHIMWIVGYRQNQAYQVTDKTRRILEVEFYGGKKDGGDS